MPLVVVQTGQVIALDSFIDAVPLLCFPFRNDRTPVFTDTIADYLEADFSGYSGAQPLASWNPVELRNGRAYVDAMSVGWIHNGGPIDNYIYGVCVVTMANELVWAIRDPQGPTLVNPSNPTYSYSPVVTQDAEFKG